MDEKKLQLIINHDSDIPKYQQLVNTINNAIAENFLAKGEQLPSVNSICNEYKLSRDTVFKAYSILKDQRFIESVPNKGYFVVGETRKVLLVLDTFKAYKEVLYHSFVNNLPENIIVDIQFHHYNIENFKTIINNSIGKYYKYVVMPFDNKEVAAALSTIANNKLLLIDWNIHSKAKNNYVFQDFGKAFYEAIKQGESLLRKYNEIVFLYPAYTNHPKETLSYFKKFCTDSNLSCKVLNNTKDFEVEKNKAYLSVSDRLLGIFLEQCRDKNLEPGKDVGLLSYNETPMKKFIYKGISVITTDFNQMGTKAAEFITKDEPIKYYIPTNLIIRESL